MVDSQGHGGGLAMSWKDRDEAKLMSYSTNHIDLEIFGRDNSKWRLTGFYGFPERNRRRQSWDSLRTLCSKSSRPWCCIGDYNDLLFPYEKRGGKDHPQWLFSGFREVVDDCSLLDLGMIGYPFTWECGRGTSNWIEDRFDRAMVTPNWSAMFRRSKVWNLEATASDHSPIFLEVVSQQFVQRVRRFRFENSWLKEVNCHSIVAQSWQGSLGLSIERRMICMDMTYKNEEIS
ncbi:hypothetical protein DH2020_012409 [Rehmannia glutinosa]|uniref:Endonuclease/exonuclease/phosphatase domain-containing protein n=1 Tax=Rehmannia glutinosa TaxID=99300 RepID=A0ABR0X2T6_REHGL